MDLSHEDIVTKMLSNREIINANYDELNTKMYSTNPMYDLTHYLKTAKPEPSKWGEKYLFVN